MCESGCSGAWPAAACVSWAAPEDGPGVTGGTDTLWLSEQTDRSNHPASTSEGETSATLNSFQVHFHSDVTIRVFQASGTISVQFINRLLAFSHWWNDGAISQLHRQGGTSWPYVLFHLSLFILSFVFMQILNLTMLNKPTMHVVM